MSSYVQLDPRLRFGKPWFVDAVNGNDAFHGKNTRNPFATLQAAHDAASAGDVVIAASGDYAETLTITKDNLVFYGAGARGSVAVEASAANGNGVVIDGTTARVEEVLLHNIGGAGKGTGAGMHIKGDIRRITAERCKFENQDETGAAVVLESIGSGISVGDVVLQDCELALAAKALHLKATGGGDPVTQAVVRGCDFNRFSGVGVQAETVHTQDLRLYDNKFGRLQDGTEPTDYLLLNVASTTGHVAGNQFATATNAAAVLTIAAGVIWGANATEAGWSSARPV